MPIGAALFAQPTTGSIGGAVWDPSGAAAAGAAVTLENQATGWRMQALANLQGGFAFPALPPGTYSVSVRRDGFKTLKQGGIVLILDQKLWLDLKLELGKVNQATTVSDSPPALETQSADTGLVIEGDQILDLPLLGRNFLDLARLAPGVAPGAGGNNVNLSIDG